MDSDSDPGQDPLDGVISFLEENKEVSHCEDDDPSKILNDNHEAGRVESAHPKREHDMARADDYREMGKRDAAEAEDAGACPTTPARDTAKRTSERRKHSRDKDLEQQVLRRFKAEQRLLKIKQNLDEQVAALIRQHNADQDSQDSQRILRIPSDSEEDLPAEAESGLELENELKILRARKAKVPKGKTTL